jgi:hypothetical protein
VKGRRLSARRYSASVGLSDRSVRRILHKYLTFRPYKIVTVQELNGRDMANRRISSKKLLEKLNDVATINAVLMTDEAHFHLSGYVNKQNYRRWTAENRRGKLEQCLRNGGKLLSDNCTKRKVACTEFFNDGNCT